MNKELWKYLRNKKKHVNGWLQRVDAEIFGAILEYQYRENITGGCAEIGIHHGKSFIPLCMALRENELALAVDLFEEQDKNLDSSGKGDFITFQNNLAKFHVDASQIRIFKGSSEEIKPDYISQQVGPVRFFSVDGGHWKSIVQNDLRLAEHTVARGGVIALDDYFRAEWPDVTTAYTLWQQETKSNIVPFAIGSNKLFLCHKKFAAPYQNALKTPFLNQYFTKRYSTDIAEIDSYRVELASQDETGVKIIITALLKIFRPNIFVALKSKLRGNKQ